MIIVPTIPCSGTHLVLDMLGVKPKGMLWTETENNVAYGHIYPDMKDKYLPLIEQNLTIIPLRHPNLVAKSWRQRHQNVDELAAMWDILIKEIEPLSPYIIPIDSYDRDYYLKQLNEEQGLDLKTDWKPIGSKNNNHALRAEPTEYMGEFLNRFYPC